MQRQNAVSAYFTSKQILHFVFAEYSYSSVDADQHGVGVGCRGQGVRRPARLLHVNQGLDPSDNTQDSWIDPCPGIRVYVSLGGPQGSAGWIQR